MHDDKFEDKKTIEELEKKKKSVHDGHRDRLRKRFNKDDEMATFADHEVLELQLSLVIPRRDVNELAHNLIDHYGSLDSVYRASIHELIKFKGMTINAAYLIAIQRPLMRRIMSYADLSNRKNPVTTSFDIIGYANSFFIDRKSETLGMFLLDARGKVIKEIVREGSSPTHVGTDIEHVVHTALKEGAVTVVLAHNHPSGDVSPSIDDVHQGQKLFDALKSINVTLGDLIIFYESKFFSFRTAGLINGFEANHESAENEKHLSTSRMTKKILMNGVSDFIVDFARLYEGKGETELEKQRGFIRGMGDFLRGSDPYSFSISAFEKLVKSHEQSVDVHDCPDSESEATEEEVIEPYPDDF